uniref:Nuclear transport factor 2 family protein n=1 Tax=candidate division WOR-3 bacterium TaxID=2052148 RepID=A0A7C3J5N9_UNCW3
MLKKFLPILFFLIVLISCSFNSDSAKIKKVIYKNVDAMNKKDIETYMETIDPKDTAEYNSTKNIVGFIFKNMDVEVKIDTFSIISLADDTARVLVRMYFTVKGEEEHKSNMEHFLIKREGKWYINNSITLQ